MLLMMRVKMMVDVNWATYIDGLRQSSGPLLRKIMQSHKDSKK